MVIGTALTANGSRAIDSLEELDRVPDAASAEIYTNRVDVIGPAVDQPSP